MKIIRANYNGYMKRYDAILFDLDGTLRASEPEGFEIFVHFARRVGIELSDEQARQIERTAHLYWASGARVDSDLARFDQRGFWAHYNMVLLESVGVNMHDEGAIQHANAIQDLFDKHYDPIDMIVADAFTLLDQLKQKGYTLGLVSNRDGELDTYATKLHLRQFFDFTLSGGQAKSYKPDPVIFAKALEMAGNPEPSRVLYVGDNYYADVVGAKRAGMDALLIDARSSFVGMHDKCIRHLRDAMRYIEAE